MMPEQSDQLSPTKRALLAVETLQARLEAMKRAATEPIAIVGMGCRLPGRAGSPEAFWRLLHDGVDTISEVPADRWDVVQHYDQEPGQVGKMYTRYGSFLNAVDGFDAAFFDISPREAAGMDPQQRLLLEVAWEALEDAGQTRERLAGSQTGVFIGIYNSDYSWLTLADPAATDVYAGMGSAHSVATGRLSYLLDLRGPSMPVDTACSSSLVAIHLACQSLRARESHLALAGGVNLILSPYSTILTSQLLALAPDGRCKTFDAAANGFVRGEGCGVLALKRLSDALAAGDHIWALIRGSAVNQDGHSSGLTAPNLPAQTAVIRRALTEAGVSAARIGYVEAHGTGTPLGDPIEVEALSAAYAASRESDAACALGSVKTNIGHLEAAAGVAGLVKVVLALRHGIVPPHLHFNRLNPRIRLEGTPFFIPTHPCPWPIDDGPRFAGVSAFSFSGTNAHVVLEEAPRVAQPETRDLDGQTHLLAISARGPQALRQLAQRYCELLAEQSTQLPAPSPVGLCAAAALRRTHHEHRLAVVGRSTEELREQLTAFAAGEQLEGIVNGERLAAARRKLVFVFSGQGSQWPGMGRQLLQQEPAFRASLERCSAALTPEVDWSLLDELCAEDGRSRLDQVEVGQPALWALQVSLAALWQSWGVVPTVVVGQSMGEVAAACVAGALTLADGARVICRRSRLLARLRGQGAMAVVWLAVPEAQALLRDYDGRLTVAASTGARSCVLSGEEAALAEVLALLQKQEIFCWRVQVDVAAHSPQVAVLGAELYEALAELEPRAASPTLYSTVTGEAGGELRLDAGYWVRNLCEPVRFAEAVQSLLAAGHTCFVEVSPHPLLLGAIAEGGDAALTLLPSLRWGREERATLLESLGHLYVLGYPVAWEELYGGERHWVRLPSYPWQHERYWVQHTRGDPAPEARAAGGRMMASHPLLGQRLDVAMSRPGQVWQLTLDRTRHRAFHDHRLGDATVLPASAYVALALAAAAELCGQGAQSLEQVRFHSPLVLPNEGAQPILQVTVSTAEDGKVTFGVHARAAEGWVLHASGTVEATATGVDNPGLPPSSRNTVRDRCSQELYGEDFYRLSEERGVHHGPALRSLAHIWRGDDEVLGTLDVAEMSMVALLDSSFQLAAAALPLKPADGEPVDTYTISSIGRITVALPADGVRWGHAVRRTGEADAWQVDVVLVDHHGEATIALERLCFQRLDATTSPVAETVDDWLYHVRWEPRDQGQEMITGVAGTWVIFADEGGIGRGLAARLSARGDRCVLVSAGQHFGGDGDCFTLRPDQPGDIQRLFECLLAAGQPPCRGVVHLWSADCASGNDLALGALEAGVLRACVSALQVVQQLAGANALQPPRLWLATRGAQPVRRAAALEDVEPLQAPLWGLGRVIAEEHRELWGGLVDLDPASSAAEQADHLYAEVCARDGGDQVAFRHGQRHVARLARGTDDDRPDASWRWRPDASYLITGGLGALGLHVARWMVERGARRLILLGRTGLPSRRCWSTVEAASPLGRRIAAVRDLESLGAAIHLATLDIADEAQLAAFLEDFRAEGWPAIRGVVHAAGVIEDRLLQGLDGPSLQEVLRPKVSGAWLLHRLFTGVPLDFFVLFSSIAAVLGSPGQGSYAAANAFLDALAHRRRAQGLPALCIDWSAWTGLGFAATPGGVRLIKYMALQGGQTLAAAQALCVLDHLMRRSVTQAVVMRVDRQRLQQSAQYVADRPLLATMVSVAGGAPQEDGTPATARTDVLALASGQERQAFLEAHLREQIAAVLRTMPARLDRHAPLGTLGLDSFTTLELRNRLNRTLGLSLSATVFWSYPDIAALGAYLARRLEAPAETADSRVANAARIRPVEDGAEDLVRILQEVQSLPADVFQRLPAGEL